MSDAINTVVVNEQDWRDAQRYKMACIRAGITHPDELKGFLHAFDSWCVASVKSDEKFRTLMSARERLTAKDTGGE